jgi:hypothetical protein
VAAFVEPFGAREHDLADPVERVVAAVTVAQGLVLDPAPHRVEAPVADTHDVERIRDAGGVIVPADEPGPVGLGRSVATTPMPSSQSRGWVSSHRRRSPALLPSTRSIRIRWSRSTSPVAYRVGWSRVARRNEVSSTPRAVTSPTRSGSSMSGRPCSSTAVMIVHQHTPSSSASSDTGRAFSPTWRHASAPARMVSTARDDTCSEVSVHVRAAHNGSRQRHRRLRHTSRAGRPNAGRSRISTVIRSWASARTPQPAQPTRTAVVSISITTSAKVSVTASTRNPSSPNSASANPIPSPTAGVSTFFVVVTSHEDRGTPAPRGGPSATGRSLP